MAGRLYLIVESLQMAEKQSKVLAGQSDCRAAVQGFVISIARYVGSINSRLIGVCSAILAMVQ
jgi:hypothetical protein